MVLTLKSEALASTSIHPSGKPLPSGLFYLNRCFTFYIPLEINHAITKLEQLTLSEANEILVNKYEWNPHCMPIMGYELARIKSDWESEGRDFAFNKFIERRKSCERGAIADFKKNICI